MSTITYRIVVAFFFAVMIDKAKLEISYTEDIKENVGLGIGAIIGIIVAAVVVVVGCCICICYFCCQCCRKSQPVIVNQTSLAPAPTIIAFPAQDRNGGFSNMMSEVSPPPYTDDGKFHH